MQRGLYKSTYEHDSCGIGFVASIKGEKSYDIIRRGLEVLERMQHRGAESADNKTGDGSGIMMQIPHAFYADEISSLPALGSYGTGLVFLPRDTRAADYCIREFEGVVQEEGQRIIAWRDVPVDNSDIGEIAARSEPVMRQVFITGGEEQSQEVLERKLYIIRKIIEKRIRDSTVQDARSFYIPSLSSRTIVYKGMLMPSQVKSYFDDLHDLRMSSAIALVHSRFSTNTFPSWDLAQPFRLLAHNGEINTIKGNRFWMQARESSFASDLFGDDLYKILPVIEQGKSDSASFDNALEMLVATGRSLPHALMMLIPESWNEKNPLPDRLKYFYEYHSTFMEPWDGPASMVFCDGRYVGGTLDRNGLRPSRFVITKDSMIVMASEVGVQTFPPEEIASKGRLMPGKLLLIDTEEGRIIPDEEVKEAISHRRPYRQWVESNRIKLADIPSTEVPVAVDSNNLHEMQILHGYSREDIENLLVTMVNTGAEPTGSMGTDTPLAAFSDKPQRLFNYFKQVFAQVTNPAIDPIREELVMTLTSFIGGQKNLLSETAEHCRRIKFTGPIFSNADLAKIENFNDQDFRTKRIHMTFPLSSDGAGLDNALEMLFREAEEAVDKGYGILILSDRGINGERLPIPSLLACSGVHHYLIRAQKRTRVGLIIETAEAREVMHFALLFGFGADAINPYGVFAIINSLIQKGRFSPALEYRQAEHNFIKAIEKGLLKVLSKMGTSTLRSYRGSQIFEAVGLGSELIDKYFTGTESRIGGIGLEQIVEEVRILHERAFVNKTRLLESEGMYSYRRRGERHAWNPDTIHLLQWASRTNDYEKYKEFARIVNEQNRQPHFIRGLFDLRPRKAIPIDEVEPVEEIRKRFTTGAMSFGSLSIDAHEAIAAALNALGGRSNSGEGGENPERFVPRPDGTVTRSAIKQVASGRFGVTSNYLVNADEIQIKIAQGAKPGEGGQLPGHKVDKIIARTRYATRGVTLISPPPHHDIYSIEDLAQLIFDLKNANPSARISVKLVSESGVGTIAAGVAKAHADNILISGFEGGTGASPQSSIRHAGLPWEIGLSETHQTLVLNDLRGRVRLQTDGQLKTGRDIVLAGILGAEEFGFGTVALIVLGCVMMRKCHMNTCPVGIATQDPKLRKRFAGKPEHLINYLTFVAAEVREIMAKLGVLSFNELIGRTDLIEVRSIDHWKAKTLDPSPLLYIPQSAEGGDRAAGHNATYCVQSQVHRIERVLDRNLIKRVRAALEEKQQVKVEFPIRNVDRTTGAMLSGEVSRRYGEEGLPDNTILCTFHGSAGQSFGAFLTRGITFRLEGDANDYFGKGLSGGRLIAVPPSGSTFAPEDNIIIGNTVLYGATSGEAFIRGVVGERFCVRNSGAIAVVEGTGDHCAEYMTGGRIIVLGKVGRNFAAGMSGGIAYVLNKDGTFEYFCNRGMVELTPLLEYVDQEFVKGWLQKHIDYTGSSVALEILENWHVYMPKFIKVIPLEYKRALQEIELEQIDERLKAVREEEQLEVFI